MDHGERLYKFIHRRGVFPPAQRHALRNRLEPLNACVMCEGAMSATDDSIRNPRWTRRDPARMVSQILHSGELVVGEPAERVAAPSPEVIDAEGCAPLASSIRHRALMYAAIHWAPSRTRGILQRLQ